MISAQKVGPPSPCCTICCIGAALSAFIRYDVHITRVSSSGSSLHSPDVMITAIHSNTGLSPCPEILELRALHVAAMIAWRIELCFVFN
jgi:hypothetical protein